MRRRRDRPELVVAAVSAVVGVDLSTRALDLVKLNESDDRAVWVRCELQGKDAWERTLSIRSSLLKAMLLDWGHSSWWDDVYLVAIEAPMGHGSNKLDRVLGAIAASLPEPLRRPERCWVVRASEWKHGLGLKGKPTAEDLERLCGTAWPFTGSEYREPASEHARDAYCLALWARDTLAAASRADTPHVGAPSSPDRKAL